MNFKHIKDYFSITDVKELTQRHAAYVRAINDPRFPDYILKGSHRILHGAHRVHRYGPICALGVSGLLAYNENFGTATIIGFGSALLIKQGIHTYRKNLKSKNVLEQRIKSAIPVVEAVPISDHEYELCDLAKRVTPYSD